MLTKTSYNTPIMMSMAMNQVNHSFIQNRTMTATTTLPYCDCRTKANSNKKGYACWMIARGTRNSVRAPRTMISTTRLANNTCMSF